MNCPSLSIRTVASLAELDTEEVARLASGRGVFTSPPYLAFMEDMRREKGVWYVVCRRELDGRLVGICPIYDGGTSPGSYWDPNRHYLARAAGAGDDAAWSSCRFFGIRSGYGWSPLLDHDLTPEDGALVQQRMLGSVPDGPLAVMFLSDHGRATMSGPDLPEGEFFLAGASSVILLEAESFESYLNRLPRPDNGRREISVFEASGATTALRSVPQAGAQVAAHFVQHAVKYGGRTTLQAEVEELERLHAAMADAVRLIGLYRDGQSIGGVLLLEWENTIYVRQIGFDYQRTGSAFEYFNLAYYATVRHALECGVRRIDYGMATYRAKLARGAIVEPLWGIARDREGRSLMDRPGFRDWDRRRRGCVAIGSATALEQAELP